jgi:hypothetical protein
VKIISEKDKGEEKQVYKVYMNGIIPENGN